MTKRWENLVNAIRALPGVGPKMAERLALYLLRSSSAESLVNAIQEARANLKNCGLCGIYTEVDPCPRCVDPTRDRHLLCIVEEAADMMALEKSGAYRGHYHLLGGVLSPLDGVGPRELRIDPLLKRIKGQSNLIQEVIMATNPTVEGEATATYLAQLIQPLGPRVSRLAYGLPSGASLEYTDELTLSRAFEGRQAVSS